MQATEKSKINIKWNVTPYNYSKEAEKQIIAKASKKYGVAKDRIRVQPEFISIDEDGNTVPISSQYIDNIQDPKNQIELMKSYIKVNNIEDCDFDMILSIDNEINAKIDYHVYDKYRKYSLKWLKWSNFQSYGPDNEFRFDNLKGLILLNGEPANQSGKTTFAVDLLYFLLFGKSDKYDTQAELFNDRLDSATQVLVEGCLTIDGEDFVIKRTLTRPQLSKRTDKSKVTQKVEYYKLVGEDMEELEDYIENQQGEDTKKTNKIIKEAIGREQDFKLIMCVTGKTLDDLIDEKPTERGRLLARWIGLLPIEQKEELAKDKFNNTIKPYLLSNRYDRETLSQEISACKVLIDDSQAQIDSEKKTCESIESDIKTLESTKEETMKLRSVIDSNVLKIDIKSINDQIEATKINGQKQKIQFDEIKKSIEEIGEVDFSVEDYDVKTDKLSKLNMERGQLLSEVKFHKQHIETLKTSEYCPTCKRKLDNVDNSTEIAKQESELNDIIAKGKKVANDIATLTSEIEAMKVNREKYNKKNSLTIQKSAIEVEISELRAKYKELDSLIKEYNKNSEAIDRNNNIEIQIRNIEANINSKRQSKETFLRSITQQEASINVNKKNITDREELIKKLNEEEKLLKNWKIYLDMVGKNGISKMVMRKALPIINVRLRQLLDGICDFDVEVVINNRNEVAFKFTSDDKTKSMNGGSGFEQTAAALALRCVLADISTIPRLSGIIFDELLGRVAKENYENMHTLYDRILASYDYILHITHLEEVKDWHNEIITVTKDANRISSLKQSSVKKVR